MSTHNGRTAEGRRVRDLARAYLAAMGWPVSVILQAAAVAAAEAVVIAEQARQRVLQGDRGVTYDDLVRLDHQADRKVRRLGIGKPVEAPAVQPNVLRELEQP